jgi:hypothetical protein
LATHFEIKYYNPSTHRKNRYVVPGLVEIVDCFLQKWCGIWQRLQFLPWESGLSNLLGSGEAEERKINAEHVPLLLLFFNILNECAIRREFKNDTDFKEYYDIDLYLKWITKQLYKIRKH